jgi:hypothetical protein
VVTAVPPAAPPPRARKAALAFLAQAAAARVVSPYVNLGGAIGGRLGLDGGEGRETVLGLSLLYVSNDVLQSPGEVVVHWTALALTACEAWHFGPGFELGPCASGVGGWLAATERAVTNPASAGRSWWSLGALLRAVAPLGGGLAVELDAGVDVPLLHRRFVITTPERTVAETPAVAPMVALGLRYRL